MVAFLFSDIFVVRDVGSLGPAIFYSSSGVCAVTYNVLPRLGCCSCCCCCFDSIFSVESFVVYEGHCNRPEESEQFIGHWFLLLLKRSERWVSQLTETQLPNNCKLQEKSVHTLLQYSTIQLNILYVNM